MSSPSSFRLESRSRPPPPPLRLHNFTPSSSSPKDTLLYDLPSPPPTSPTSGLLSPTSPTSPSRTRRSSSRTRGITPPPSSRPRSVTPSQRVQSDLEDFAVQCREWYYNQDDGAGRLMTQTLATLPPSHRAPFARLQASIRSAYHTSLALRRTTEFRAHLSATHPGGSLLPHARADPMGPMARRERHERLERFIRTWCTLGMPGTRPFFEGLWAVLRLQVLPENLGGAGGWRIEWEFDDAVFMESAGKEFMLDAIDVLKGVLAFEEYRSSRSSTNGHSPTPSVTSFHARSYSQPLPSATVPEVKPSSRHQIASTAHAKRPRAPSDPFLDRPPILTMSLSSRASITSPDDLTPPIIVSATNSSPSERDRDGFDVDISAPSPMSPRTTSKFLDNILPHPDTGSKPEVSLSSSVDDGVYTRMWVFPAHVRNPELATLLALFPSFLGRRVLPRFPVPSASAPRDIEEGGDVPGDGEIRFGTGCMRISGKEREAGWRGGWWERFVGFWKHLFC